MALDLKSKDFFEWLSTWKKWTWVLIQKIQQELRNSSIWDISEYKWFWDIAPSFVEWKMKYNNSLNVLLALIDKKDKESLFFRTFLSKEILDELSDSRSKLLETLERNA